AHTKDSSISPGSMETVRVMVIGSAIAHPFPFPVPGSALRAPGEPHFLVVDDPAFFGRAILARPRRLDPLLLQHAGKGLFANILEVIRAEDIGLAQMIKRLHFPVRWALRHQAAFCAAALRS